MKKEQRENEAQKIGRMKKRKETNKGRKKRRNK
jgi:hypothetical protein